jgi:CMP-2-keto-3-deoxyoctulosonic acid synthetase
MVARLKYKASFCLDMTTFTILSRWNSMSKQNEALYFSRATIPYDRDGAKHDEPTLHSQAFRHLGLYDESAHTT